VPFDAVAGLPDAQARRVARNTLLVLQEEAHLDRVIDPPGGSWYLDWLTEQVAEKAWAVFQEVERRGGMLRALCDGWVARQIDSAFAPRAKNLARRKEGITGVSEFPNVGEAPVVRPAPDRTALRHAAVQRVVSARRDSPALTAPPWAAKRVATAAEAAEKGASLGQLASALGFHAEPTFLPPLMPHPFAE